MIALVVGTVLALGGLAFVLMPVILGTGDRRAVVAPVRRGAGWRSGDAESGATAIDALREIEFDRATGKLSDADYAALRASYTEAALTEMRARESSDDVVEAAVLEYRLRRPSCPTHGQRPESDATYCSECGTYLTGICADCGAPVTEPAARFCAGCGAALAA
jgi:hypothetical protein